jgi:hypothetical protein
MSSTCSGVVDILVSLEFYLCWVSLPRFQCCLIKRPNGLTSNLLIMLILLQSRSERSEFSWLQRFRWFWSTFSTNFYGFEIPRFHKISCPDRYLRSCIKCVETPGFHIPTGWLFCIMHAFLLSTNWFRCNVGGMLLIVWNSLIWIWILCQWMLIHRWPKSPDPAACAWCRLPVRDRNGMNGGRVSHFHVFRANVLTLHDVNSLSGYQGIKVFD